MILDARCPGRRSSALDRRAGFAVGDDIDLQVGAATHRLRVSGLAHTPGAASPTFTGRAIAYMREAELQALFNVGGANVTLVRLDDYGQRTTTARQLGQVLANDGVVVLQSQVGRDVSGGSSSTITSIFTVMQVLSVVALLLSVFLLLTTTIALIAEQVPVIGTMKAIGATGRRVLGSYLLGVAVYGVLGTIAGLALGIGFGDLLYRYFAVNLGMDPSLLLLSPSLFVTAAAVGLGVPLLAAAVPIYLGTRITVRQALTGYGISNGGRLRPGGWGALVRRSLGFLPESAQLGLRSLFRRRTRALLTISGLAISGAAFLAVQTTTTSWNAVLGDVFASNHVDVYAVLDSPQPAATVDARLAAVPGIAQTEPLSRTPVQTRWGTALLTGVVTDPVLYRQKVVSGRWLTDSDRDAVLISDDAAQRSRLRVGDRIDFHTDLSSASWQIVGIVKDLDNPAGAGVLLTTLAQANAFSHLPPDYLQTVMIRSTSSRQADIDGLARSVDSALGGTPAHATVITASQEVQRNQSVFLALYALFYSVVAVIALVGGIGLFNTLAMGVLERQREIGILRSMGGTGARVALVFWTEGVGLGMVAWAAAVVIGIPAAYGFVQLLGAVLLRSPFAFNPLSLLEMAVFVVAVASLATIGPVLSASRVRIAETLRYE